MTEVRDPGRTAVKIWLMSDTREVLKALGRKGESYDAVIRRLINHYAETRPLELGEAARKLPDIEKEAAE